MVQNQANKPDGLTLGNQCLDIQLKRCFDPEPMTSSSSINMFHLFSLSAHKYRRKIVIALYFNLNSPFFSSR